MSRTLYQFAGSPAARAVMMVVDLVKVPDIKYKNVNLRAGDNMKEDYLKLNPQHTVPTLVDGDFVIWDSHAIAAYLVGTYAADDTLYPKDLKKRAVVDQRLHFDSGVLFPGLGISIAGIVKYGKKGLSKTGLENVQQGYDFLEKFLEDRTWLTGDVMTIADICCVATTSSNNEFAPVDPAKYPNITRWFEQFSKLDFYNNMNKPGCATFGEFIRSQMK